MMSVPWDIDQLVKAWRANLVLRTRYSDVS